MASLDRSMNNTSRQRREKRVHKIISGGQTGTDQAALRAAIEAGLEVGGWCPPTKTCETGLIPLDLSQHLWPTPTEKSPRAPPNVERSLRTEWNVRDSDATLIFQLRRSPSSKNECPVDQISCPGTQWTFDCARLFYPSRKIKIVNLDASSVGLRFCENDTNRIKSVGDVQLSSGSAAAEIASNVADIANWLDMEMPQVNTLNVAGPSEETCPGVGNYVHDILSTVLSQWDDVGGMVFHG